MASNAVPPSVTPPSPDEWPQNLIKAITGITNDSQAVVTCPSHGYDENDLFVTSVMFLQVQGMLPINGMPAVVQRIIDVDRFVVNINTTGFPTYRGAGIVRTLTGEPPIQKQSFQYFNTPFQNIAP